MGLVHVADCLMKSLWSIAKLRYLNERLEWLNLWTAPVYADVTRRLAEGEKAGIFLDSMHMKLAYYIDPEAEEPPHTRRPNPFRAGPSRPGSTSEISPERTGARRRRALYLN